MPGPNAIDASVFLSALIEGEHHHEVSRLLLDRIRLAGTPMISPTPLLPEMAVAVGRGKGNPEKGIHLAGALGMLPGLILVDLDRKLARKAVELAARNRLRGSDAVYGAAASRFNAPLITLDREQHGRLSAVLQTYYPAEAIAIDPELAATPE